jgi:SAM-dependent methyltransferase
MIEHTLQVQAIYERRPYPHYPLLAKPQWQDGYLGSSLFASKLLLGRGRDTTMPQNFLSIGCGEILPYILRQWEPSVSEVHCVDLSQRSLRRARFRTALLGGRISYRQDDINHLLQHPPYDQLRFEHVEAYGVLHHIPSFKTTLDLIRRRLSANGLVRIMVYNRFARDWIWDINRAFALLDLRFHSDRDVGAARDLLAKLAHLSPRLAQRLAQMGSSSLASNTRFADTFLHPWESRATVKTWFDTIQSAGLRPVALHDRYAELDDLPNPLWQCPSSEQLTDRALDLRFENNLELWLTRDDLHTPRIGKSILDRSHATIPWRLRLTMPPNRLGYFEETKSLSIKAKIALWQGFLRTIYNHEDRDLIKLIKDFEPDTAKRLARMGLILPTVAQAAGILDELRQPLTTSMSPPKIPTSSASTSVSVEVASLCAGIQKNHSESVQAALRLIRVM